ncbi:MAG TPA: hypothetical protein VFB00_06705 [Terriglobales bacterium]|nr:hypothetical protein [Terriglobales bacterium]
MSRDSLFLSIAVFGFMAGITCPAQKTSTASQPNSMTVIFKDGHRKTVSLTEGQIELKDLAMVITGSGHEETYPLAEIARVEFNAGNPSTLGRNHFVGKWEVGVGVGKSTFTITLDRDGQATKTLGSAHGTWTVVNGEARISWNDGWHDVIRKVGDRHEKLAFGPGKSFSDHPDNVTDARRKDAQPI